MSKATWADVTPGDAVELNGRAWSVTKIKLKGKRAKVTVKSGTHVATAEVKAADRVKRVTPPLRAADNSQARWATEGEHRKSLPPGDPAVTKRPEKPSGDPWETQRDRVEKKLDAVLGARLVGEATDESKGYYVPPVDVSTIASHLAIFHPNVYDPEKDEATMLAGHEHAHKAALEGRAKLDVNHWHTKTRP